MGFKIVFRKCVKLGGFFYYVIFIFIYSDVCFDKYYRDLLNYD